MSYASLDPKDWHIDRQKYFIREQDKRIEALEAERDHRDHRDQET